ncbi:MAG TPA: DUF6463 family protein [Chitinophaga sp.]|uniref:DUF6463 family protein n=1 Tax=Chitinophaga sp. TaxID=1869181 RepID=UPI002BC66EF5|nr:DUF6463 family protein [Chitinophaga sp.]HVI47958.1 DUF6463 family protein [Chitinophaga sp.]
MKPWIGRAVIIIGIIHNVVGIFLFRKVLQAIFSEGLLNSIHGEWDREAAFWFIISGFMMMIVGGLIQRAEREQRALPDFLGWGMLAMVIVAVCIMPVSGWWLLLIPTGGVIWRSRKVFRPSSFY